MIASWKFALVAIGGLLLCSCAGKSELQQPAQNFYNAASALAAAEPKMLTDVNGAAASLTRSEQQLKYISDKEDFTIDAPKPIVAPADYNARVDAVNAVQLYAQAILNLTGSAPDQNIDTYSESLAKNLQTGVPNRWSGLQAPDAQGLAAALSALTQLVIDQKAYSSVVDIAAKAQPSVIKLAGLIAADNALLTNEVQSLGRVSSVSRMQLLRIIRSDKRILKNTLSDDFSNLAAASDVSVTLKEITVISNLAQSLVTANAVLAKGDTPTFAALAQDAYRRGADAYSVFQSSKK
ncbi:MAG: hypothetical protein JO128_11700 [Alphaproteobacteria bacterium]|nr:hypothetical protein [Alphaproteobacteria bacterium]